MGMTAVDRWFGEASAGELPSVLAPAAEVALPPAMAALVDPWAGLVTGVELVPLPDGAPPDYLCQVARVADTRQFAHWLSDRIAAGTSFGDPVAASCAAVGEAVERYCGNNIPPDLPVGSVTELRAGGHRVLAPGDFPGWLDVQRRRPRFPYRTVGDDESLRWATGWDHTGDRVLAPASWTYLNFHHGQRRHDPRGNHLHYSGIATGIGLADAADRALFECLERDAFVTWWLLDLPARAIAPASVPGLGEWWRDTPLELSLVALPTSFGPPVVGALVYDAVDAVPAAGFSSHADGATAAAKAAAEALQVWVASKGLLEADGPSWQAMSEGVFSSRAYLPFRADRRYLSDAGTHFRRITDLAAQTQLWLDPRLHPLMRRFWPDTPPIDIADIANLPSPGRLGDSGPDGPDVGELRQRLVELGQRVVTIDLTTEDVAATGLAVARVLTPGLQPNAPAAFQYLDSPRLAAVATTHGRPGFRPSLTNVTLAPPPHN